jgi:hypothetical protein
MVEGAFDGKEPEGGAAGWQIVPASQLAKALEKI